MRSWRCRLQDVSAGGGKHGAERRTNPPELVLTGDAWRQSLRQVRLENAGPAGSFDAALRQQHFARLRQHWQDVAGALDERAINGAKEPMERSTARHTATSPFVHRQLSQLPSIPWQRSIACAPNRPTRNPPRRTGPLADQRVFDPWWRSVDQASKFRVNLFHA
jgi:hypothetical protein